MINSETRLQKEGRKQKAAEAMKAEGLVLEPQIGNMAAVQPCSGVKVIEARVFGSGHGVATPGIVREQACTAKKNAA